jgi:hypothetical protein
MNKLYFILSKKKKKKKKNYKYSNIDFFLLSFLQINKIVFR